MDKAYGQNLTSGQTTPYNHRMPGTNGATNFNWRLSQNKIWTQRAYTDQKFQKRKSPFWNKIQEASRTRTEPAERQGIETQLNRTKPPKKSGSTWRKGNLTE